MKKYTINSDMSLLDIIQLITAIYKDKKHLTITIHPQQRSLTQNSAIHKYFDLLSVALNDKDKDLYLVLSEGVEIPWTPELIKELLWKRVQSAMFSIDSTTKLSRQQVSQVYDVIHKKMALDHDVNVQFPSKDNL